jgi:hypothetical protein
LGDRQNITNMLYFLQRRSPVPHIKILHAVDLIHLKRTHGMWKGGLFVSSKRDTEFFVEPKFEKAVRDFGPSSAAEVLSNIQDFEFDWRNRMEYDQLFARYNFKPYRGLHRPYGLFQIRVGPNRKHLSYRAVVMFYDGQSKARWIYAFKKERMSEPQEVKLAVARADECWNAIKGDYDGKN